jgi:hypothetical protein
MSGDSEILVLLRQILERQDNFHKTLHDHMEREEGVINGLAHAFPTMPDGSPDYLGHREYHSSLIDAAKERASFFREMRRELAKKGIFGLIAVVIFLVGYWWQGQK